MRRLGRPSILGVAIAGALLPWSTPASAQITIAVSPALLELEGRAGDTGHIEITISNNGDAAFEVVTGLENFQAMTDERSALAWSAVTPGRLEIDAGDDVTATFAIEIPADAPTGGRFAAITFTTVPPGATDTTSVAGQIAVPVFLTVDGQGGVDRTTSLERMAAFLEPDGRLGVRAEVRNDGNVHVPFAGTVELTAHDRTLEANVDLVAGRVLPGVTRTYQGSSTLPLPLAMTYDVTLRMGTSDEGDEMIGDAVHERTITMDATPALELSVLTICENLDQGPSIAAELVNPGSLGVVPTVTFAVLDAMGSPIGSVTAALQPLAWPGSSVSVSAELPVRPASGPYTLVATATYGGSFREELRVPFAIGGDPASAAPLCTATTPAADAG